MGELHVDIETYSSVDIKSCGAYKYLESVDFEILMIAYAFGDDPVQIVDLAQGENIPVKFLEALKNPNVKKYAHNATFERQAFLNFGIPSPIKAWHCTAVHSAYCGLPLSLDMVSKALHFGGDKAKLATGKALIRYFSIPCKPTKANGGRIRNLPCHAPEKWEQYKKYCMQDVEAEREIERRLKDYQVPDMERRFYILDQKINDKGVIIDSEMAKNAFKINRDYSAIIKREMKALTGVENPNSLPQLKKWVSEAIGKEVKSLAKEDVSNLLAEEDNEKVRAVLHRRQMLSKSSIKKYTAMLNCICSDSRGRGFFQFYGANRTGRWAGRLVQLQNLTKNYLLDLTLARETVKAGDYKQVELLYGNVPDTLSQLIRTTFVAPKGKTFAIADFSAIEARVTAWLAEEDWRIKVFNTHGKIYEASASSMFGVPMDSISKGSPLRQRGKVAELALGYQGGVGALTNMDINNDIPNEEKQGIVDKWRAASPNIVQLWKDLEACTKRAIKLSGGVVVKSKHRGLEFCSDGRVLTIKLPSGRKLFYCNPRVAPKTVRKPNGETWEAESIIYLGMEQNKKQWTKLDTYGGKLTENIVQAISRDLLAESMLRLDRFGFDIVMHVHDEVVCEVPTGDQNDDLSIMCQIMSEPVKWAKDLPLAADGYLTDYYKKD